MHMHKMFLVILSSFKMKILSLTSITLIYNSNDVLKITYPANLLHNMTLYYAQLKWLSPCI